MFASKSAKNERLDNVFILRFPINVTNLDLVDSFFHCVQLLLTPFFLNILRPHWFQFYRGLITMTKD